MSNLIAWHGMAGLNHRQAPDDLEGSDGKGREDRPIHQVVPAYVRIVQWVPTPIHRHNLLRLPRN